jgi:hypothetical protein
MTSLPSLLRNWCSFMTKVTENKIEPLIQLTLGGLSDADRSALLQSVLRDPAQARLTQLALRLERDIQHTSCAMVAAAHASKPAFFNPRHVLVGACASFAMLAVFSLNAPGPGTRYVAPNVVAGNDRFGPAGSFEADTPMMQTRNLVAPELNDRFGGGGFEAN